MRLLRDVRLPPLAWVGIAAAVVAILRFVAALQVRTPLYYPDEYVNTAIARGFADGTLGHFRGGSIQTAFAYTSYLTPLLQAPAWLVDDVDVAYRLAQGLGVAAFAAAAFPTYAIARRLGVSAAGAILAALLALVVPAGAFSLTLLSEPYAYTLFLVAVLVGLEALVKGTPALHVAALVAAVGLCFVGGIQFGFVAVAYVAAWFFAGAWSPRAVLTRSGVMLGGSAAAFLLLSIGPDRPRSILTSELSEYRNYPLEDVGSGLGVNAFVLAIAAGWVLIPTAVLGIAAMIRNTDRRLRSFGLLSTFLLLGALLQAALWSASGQGVYERFTFYGAPLLALAFVWAGERPAPQRATYSAVAYATAAAAVLVPATDLLGGDDHSLALIGLDEVTAGDRIGPIIWAPALALLAAWTGLRGPTGTRVLAWVALALCACTSLGASVALVRLTHGATSPPKIEATNGSALVTWSGADPFFLDKTLFWNPAITRVVVLGPGGASDRFPFVKARLTHDERLVDASGRQLEGPFVIGPDVLAVGGGASGRERQQFVHLSEAPMVLAFGWYRALERVGNSGIVFAGADAERRRVDVELRAPTASMTFAFRCGDDSERKVEVGRAATPIRIDVAPNSVQSCRFAMIRGALEPVEGYAVSAAAKLELDR